MGLARSDVSGQSFGLGVRLADRREIVWLFSELYAGHRQTDHAGWKEISRWNMQANRRHIVESGNCGLAS